LNHVSSCIRTVAALATVAIAAAGCSAANNATSSQASAQVEQPYRTGYGLTSDGPTTDVYTAFFKPDPPPAPPTVAAAQPAQPVLVRQAGNGAGPAPAGRTPQAATTQPAPGQPAPVQVAQQPGPPPAPQEAGTQAGYGISSNGPTTDVYTMIFGPRHSDGQ
jgi:hypothetical protein